ncbi:TCR/Tet family MFS transporter [Lysobacter soyae]|uniref:TCR/Tet family MFS transporter n=1 Tax=Lysobacter soyae TaxID=2764185 RepID=A0ABX8WQL6_9GAMM|nr:TCR/Tet family MFS transporter [Lysobacter sp. CJ11]QYR53129.1 TCR/Tet family MFS transporter [Lysobacter sp. CJ11]
MQTTLKAPQRKAALVFIFITVLIDILAFGLIIPVLPHLVEQFVGGDTKSAAYWVGIFGTVFAAIQFFSAPIQGALSDRFGRRPVILLSCLGLGLDFIFMALAPSLMWLFVGRVISAVTSASFTTANAYIADVTPKDKRAGAFGMVGMAFGVGFIIGPMLGGWLGHYDLRYPFWGAAVLALANFLYGLFVLPESLAPENRSRAIAWRHANPVGSVKLILQYPQLFALALILLLSNLAHYVYPSVFVLYADYRYDWGPLAVGKVLAVVGVCSALVQGFLVRKWVPVLGEHKALVLGLLAGVVGFAAYGAAPTGTLFLCAVPIMALWGLAGPAAQALVTREVGPEVQGRIQGAMASLVSLAGIIGPALYTFTFAKFIGRGAPIELPGIPWFIAASLLGMALVLAFKHWRTHPDTQAGH